MPGFNGERGLDGFPGQFLNNFNLLIIILLHEEVVAFFDPSVIKPRKQC